MIIITINLPDKLNSLNKQTIEELHETFVDAENNKDIRALIITGSGQKAFVAGADIAEFANFSVEEGKQLSWRTPRQSQSALKESSQLSFG